MRKPGNGAVAFDETLRKKAELLLGIKGYVTNISEDKLGNADEIIHSPLGEVMKNIELTY